MSSTTETGKQKAVAKARDKLARKDFGEHVPKLPPVDPVNVAAHLEPDTTVAKGNAPSQTGSLFSSLAFCIFFFFFVC